MKYHVIIVDDEESKWKLYRRAIDGALAGYGGEYAATLPMWQDSSSFCRLKKHVENIKLNRDVLALAIVDYELLGSEWKLSDGSQWGGPALANWITEQFGSKVQSSPPRVGIITRRENTVNQQTAGFEKLTIMSWAMSSLAIVANPVEFKTKVQKTWIEFCDRLNELTVQAAKSIVITGSPDFPTLVVSGIERTITRKITSSQYWLIIVLIAAEWAGRRLSYGSIVEYLKSKNSPNTQTPAKAVGDILRSGPTKDFRDIIGRLKVDGSSCLILCCKWGELAGRPLEDVSRAVEFVNKLPPSPGGQA